MAPASVGIVLAPLHVDCFGELSEHDPDDGHRLAGDLKEHLRVGVPSSRGEAGGTPVRVDLRASIRVAPRRASSPDRYFESGYA
jgi:hypothetical protein